MNLAFFWLPFGIGVVVAFWIGLREKSKSTAYPKAMYAGTPIVFLPGCAPMLVGKSGNAEEFFWILPLYIVWFVAGPVAVAYARLLKDDDVA